MTWTDEQQLPEPRQDGKCSGCERRDAVTRDGLFCLKCLRAIVREQTPTLRDLNRRGTDQTGRSARSTATLSGAPRECEYSE